MKWNAKVTMVALMTALVAMMWVASPLLGQGAPPGNNAKADQPAKKKDKGWLGVSLKATTEEEAKALGYDHPLVRIDTIFNGSPAEASGLQSGDLFLKLDGKTVKSVRELVKTVGSHASGDKIVLTMMRGKETFTVPILLGIRPDRRTLLRDSFIDKPAPAFAVQHLKDLKESKLADYKGKVLVVDFWATWCGPCRRAMPHLNDMSNKFSKEGLVVLGVTDEEQGEVQAFFKKNDKVDYPIVLDPGRKAHRGYMISALPTLFLIDHEGVVRDVLIGGGKKNMAKLDAKVAELLKARNKK